MSLSAGAAPGKTKPSLLQRQKREEKPMSREETRTTAAEPEATPEEGRGTGQQLSAEEQLSGEELRKELVAELDELTQRLKEITPEYEPPPISSKGLTALLGEALSRCPKDVRQDAMERLKGVLNEDLFDPEVWKGTWYMLNYTVQYNADMVKRHFTGEYDTDDWGLDWEILDAMRPFLSFLYKVYWRAETTGIENIPNEGRALLVANHSGQLPWDGLMVGTAVLSEQPAQRLVRTLYDSFTPRVPFASAWLARMGQALATVENGTRMLSEDELVAVFPEGVQGMGKPYKERYKLARFDQVGFVKMALNTAAPIIPVSVVGAEETNISLAKLSTRSGAATLPYFPISLTFPWLGLLGFAPLPTKWYIDFGEPMAVDGYGPEAGKNLVLVSQLTDQVRHAVQALLQDRLTQRRSAFFG
jgi:1-acyl-sn-glycerol-3-phosphate acyltransferase